MRLGNPVTTYTGRVVYPLDLQIDDIDLDDIAHSLAMQCRYAGHCIRFYSVAEHCVHLSRVVPPEYALWALLHDASEAYLADIVRPLKAALPEYKVYEQKAMELICKKFGLPVDMPECVAAADYDILTDEGMQNMKGSHNDWIHPERALGIQLYYWNPVDAEDRFLRRFFEVS